VNSCANWVKIVVMNKKILGVIALYSRSVLFYLLAFLLFTALYAPKLGSIVPGNSVFERPDYLGIAFAAHIFENISFAPLKFLQFIMVQIDDPNATLLRLVSAGVVALSLLAFFKLLSTWHTRRIAVLTTLLFAASSLTLQLGKLANHEVLFLSIVPLLLLCGTWLRSKKNVHKLPLAAIIAALLLYIPGAWILIAGAIGIFRKRFIVAWKFVGQRNRIISGASFGLLIVPLIYGLARFPSQIVDWLGFSSLEFFSVSTILNQLLEIPKQLLMRGPDQPSLWLVGTPVLDVFTGSMALLGIYSYYRGPHPLRARLLLGLSLACTLIFTFGSFATVAILMPIIYILVANGLANMLQSWFTVFPKNPFARNVGVAILSIAVAITCAFHVQRYYEAWANAPATRDVFKAATPSVIQ
jgi:hypothetical protein